MSYPKVAEIDLREYKHTHEKREKIFLRKYYVRIFSALTDFLLSLTYK